MNEKARAQARIASAIEAGERPARRDLRLVRTSNKGRQTVQVATTGGAERYRRARYDSK